MRINGNGNVTIGDNCDIAPEVTFQTGGHEIGDASRRAGKEIICSQRVGNGVWIGGRSTIVGNTTIGDSCVIAACACVVHDVEAIFDNVTRIICIIGICVPSFWLALILLTAFAVNIPIFHVIADGSIKSLILPSIAMAVPIICISTRVLRASVLMNLKAIMCFMPKQGDFLDSVYMRLSQNSQPNSDTPDMNSRKER